ncbi:MAG: (2Fe-2S) ferredoxin domain-containing protein [Deltaproteobacteria bacterium]|nr:(2Fe-2S) ferredoxin domain-containing protein [Deltaproteobacteria bacterium]
MNKPESHIFVCASFRASAGDTKGVCHKKGSIDFLPYIENEILDRGLGAMVSSCGCLKLCDNGPVMIVYPQNYWYGSVDSEEKIDSILDALEEGKSVKQYLLA